MTTMTLKTWLTAIVVAIIAGAMSGALMSVLLAPSSSTHLGSIDNGAIPVNVPYWFTNGTNSGNVLYAGQSQQFSVDETGDITGNKTTLTRAGLCIQFYATSTSQENYMIASSTATVNGHKGMMLFGYGTCP